MITLKQVSFSFDQDRIILDKINLNIPENKFITIIGPSGSGKTIFAKLLAGITAPSEGQILIDGIDLNPVRSTNRIESNSNNSRTCSGYNGTSNGVNNSDNNHKLSQKPAYIGKNSDYNNIFATTLEELAAFGPENLGMPKEEILDSINQSLQITGLDKFRYLPIYSIPRGKKQLAALTSFLTLKPKYFILDEPTSLLDENDEKYFWNILINIRSRYGMGIIYFSNGIFIPECDDLFYLSSRGNLSTRAHPEGVPPERPKDLTEGSGIKHLTPTGSSIILKIKDLSYSPNKKSNNKNRPILEKVNLKVLKGELVFIQGNCGSGKSTLAKLIANLIEPVSGEINFPSFPSKIDKIFLRKKIGLLLQEPENQFLTETIEQEINFGLVNFKIPERERIKRIEWIFDLFYLNYNYIKKQDMLYLPLADKRKIAAASVLVIFPEIMMIDDILTGLDAKEKNIFLEAFIQYKNRKNCACIIFTSRKPDINLADQHFVLEEGSLINRGSLPGGQA